MVRLDEVCFSSAFRFDRRTMRQFAQMPGAVVLIAEDCLHDRGASPMAGFIIVHLEGAGRERYGYVVTIDVAPEFRRAGVGKQLLEQAEQQVRAAGVSRVGLHVAVDNAGAIRFYERQGYACVGVARRFYREAGLDGLIYLKDLEPLLCS
jgi:[ribosomal protein S18]-alanine N-acetyltransferase